MYTAYTLSSTQRYNVQNEEIIGGEISVPYGIYVKVGM